MTEDQVLDLIISHYEEKGWECFYRTNRGGKSIGGMDAALFCRDSNRFVIIEAKGEPVGASEKSSALIGILGTILKRIKIENGYNPKCEKDDNFKSIKGLNAKEYMRKNASLKNCEYVLAVPEKYSDKTKYAEKIKEVLEPQLASLLNIVVYIVSDSDVTQLSW